MDNFYSKNADALFEQYNKVPAEQIHCDWLHFVPDTKSLILDIELNLVVMHFPGATHIIDLYHARLA